MTNDTIYVVTVCSDKYNFSHVYDDRNAAFARFYSEVSYTIKDHGSVFTMKANGGSSKTYEWSDAKVILSIGQID